MSAGSQDELRKIAKTATFKGPSRIETAHADRRPDVSARRGRRHAASSRGGGAFEYC